MAIVLEEYHLEYMSPKVDRGTKDVLQQAVAVAMTWSFDTNLAEGVRRLFLPSDGIERLQLEIDASLILNHRGVDFPLTVFPLSRLHEEFGTQIDPVRFASIYRIAWQEYDEEFASLFQVPVDLSLEEHRQVSQRRLNLLRAGGVVPLERLVLEDPDGADLAFYDDLPEEFEVFRGSYHDEPARIGAGLGWSLDPEVALAYGNVVKAHVRKDQIGAAYARFSEIVVLPEAFEVI
ncbi:MAG: hypothetical protein CML46_21720 [Rhodobacteraceae bacterium]|nr:hypothetical protein [Paracoccaceae bacterium]MBR29528.1 hypothetical protein [Paracoccaceae bacterium]